MNIDSQWVDYATEYILMVVQGSVLKPQTGLQFIMFYKQKLFHKALYVPAWPALVVKFNCIRRVLENLKQMSLLFSQLKKL